MPGTISDIEAVHAGNPMAMVPDNFSRSFPLPHITTPQWGGVEDTHRPVRDSLGTCLESRHLWPPLSKRKERLSDYTLIKMLSSCSELG